MKARQIDFRWYGEMMVGGVRRYPVLGALALWICFLAPYADYWPAVGMWLIFFSSTFVILELNSQITGQIAEGTKLMTMTSAHIENVEGERDRLAEIVEANDEWFRKNSTVLATYRIGGYRFKADNLDPFYDPRSLDDEGRLH